MDKAMIDADCPDCGNGGPHVVLYDDGPTLSVRCRHCGQDFIVKAEDAK
jgi:uncharacterized Zn finger protein